MAVTIRSSTRAVSAGVSLPPSWLFAVELMSGLPPRSAMPTAKLTRVRVEDLSKITATVCGPSSGLLPHRSAFTRSARSRISACSAGLRSSSRRRCRVMKASGSRLVEWTTLFAAPATARIAPPTGQPESDGGEGRGEPLAERRDLRVTDDEGRRHPDRRRVDRVHDQPVLEGGRPDHVSEVRPHPDTDQQPAATDL